MAGNDVFLLNADDPVVKEYTDRYPVKCAKESFSTDSQSADCIAKDGYLEIKGEKIIPLNAIKIVGKHNLQNVMIAVSAAKAIGISNDVILEAVSSFKGVEHRIEFVREIDGVKYYNDSKGTNTDATITALKAFDRGVILLVGGFEKGLPMDEMKKHLGCVKKIIGFGACMTLSVRTELSLQHLMKPLQRQTKLPKAETPFSFPPPPAHSTSIPALRSAATILRRL